ncbi:MAG: hypothetical protein ABSE73_01740 [Planctomycetota bacterium]
MDSETGTSAAKTAPPEVSPAAAPAGPRRFSRLAVLLAGLLLAAVIGVPLLYLAYRVGKQRGREIERERIFQVEQAVVVPARESPREMRAAPAPPLSQPSPAQDGTGGPVATCEPAPAKEAPGAADPAPAAWCFTATECVRAVWPMELLPNSATVTHDHFRIREGANRLTGLDNGLCEFVFRLDHAANVVVYFHARYSDECGNSLRCSMDGGASTVLGGRKVFGEWLWDHSMRRFALAEGMHGRKGTNMGRSDPIEPVIFRQVTYGYDVMRDTPVRKAVIF